MEQTLPTIEPEISCRNCRHSTTGLHRFCVRCGFPVNGTPDEIDRFDHRQGAKQYELKYLDKEINSAKNALWIVAGIHVLYGLAFYGFMMHTIEYPLAMIISTFIVGGLFVLLGLWTRQKPFIALLSGLILYVTLFLYDVIVEGASPVDGLLIKGIVVAYLIKGINSARAAERIKKELNL